jgi:hypothetical protein
MLEGPKGEVEKFAASIPYSPPSVPTSKIVAAESQQMFEESDPDTKILTAASVVCRPKKSGVCEL